MMGHVFECSIYIYIYISIDLSLSIKLKGHRWCHVCILFCYCVFSCFILVPWFTDWCVIYILAVYGFHLPPFLLLTQIVFLTLVWNYSQVFIPCFLCLIVYCQTRLACFLPAFPSMLEMEIRPR